MPNQKEFPSRRYSMSWIWITLAFCILAIPSLAKAYNDDSAVYKWSPRYLYGGGMRRADAFVGQEDTIPDRSSQYVRVYGLPSRTGYNREGSLASRNPGFYGASRTDHMKRSSCVAAGDICLFRSGLMGTVMKMPCCADSTCTLVGHKFLCLPNEGTSLEDYYDKTGYVDDYEVAKK